MGAPLRKLRGYQALEWCWTNRDRCPCTAREIVDEALARVEREVDAACTCGKPPLVALVREDLTVVECNNAACAYVGHPPRQVRGRSLDELICSHNVPLTHALLDAARKDGVASGFVRDHSACWLSIRAHWLEELRSFWIVGRSRCLVHHPEPAGMSVNVIA